MVLHVGGTGPVFASFFSMLSLWKLRVGSEAYYLSQVASGLEDYYSGRGEVARRLGWERGRCPGPGRGGRR